MKQGSVARKKILESKAAQIAVAPGHGLYTGVRGAAELVSSLSGFIFRYRNIRQCTKNITRIKP